MLEHWILDFSFGISGRIKREWKVPCLSSLARIKKASSHGCRTMERYGAVSKGRPLKNGVHGIFSTLLSSFKKLPKAPFSRSRFSIFLCGGLNLFVVVHQTYAYSYILGFKWKSKRTGAWSEWFQKTSWHALIDGKPMPLDMNEETRTFWLRLSPCVRNAARNYAWMRRWLAWNWMNDSRTRSRQTTNLPGINSAFCISRCKWVHVSALVHAYKWRALRMDVSYPLGSSRFNPNYGSSSFRHLMRSKCPWRRKTTLTLKDDSYVHLVRSDWKSWFLKAFQVMSSSTDDDGF